MATRRRSMATRRSSRRRLLLVANSIFVSILLYRTLTSNSLATQQHAIVRYVSTDAPSNGTWLERSNLVLNTPALALLAHASPSNTTLHFTFGSIVMIDFIHNWFHYARRAGLSPALIGAADIATLDACSDEALPAIGINPDLDVWSYERRTSWLPSAAMFEVRSDWRYYRHHRSSFLEMGLVKVAFLWELVSAGFDVLISDLDVVWLNGHWQRWMAYPQQQQQQPQLDAPCAEARLISLADVLVSTDEIDPAADARGWGMGSELNTGVLFFRATSGALAVVQAWRRAMMGVRAHEFVNDQTIFNQVVREAQLTPVMASPGGALDGWKTRLRRQGLYRDEAFRDLSDATRMVFVSGTLLCPLLPCSARDEGARRCTCDGVRFTFGTLPTRAFTNGHTYFNQDIANPSRPGALLPANQPVTVHFTFQFGDTQDYPHGKRQRAREAALWAVDPPEYFSDGVFVRLVGPTFTPAQQAEVYRRFPEWSPQRHMFMDAPQRQAVRDLLGLATALDGVMVMPKLWCHCDRYWNFLRSCRYPSGPADMALPFGCPMDALFDTVRWNSKGVRFREHTFLDNPQVPQALRDNTVRVRVLAEGETDETAVATAAVVTTYNAAAATTNSSTTAVEPSTRGPTTVTLPFGTSMHQVKQAVLAANPAVRLVEMGVDDVRRLCRWLGSRNRNVAFNRLMRYVLTESSRYCPEEDHDRRLAHGAGWDWRNPFTAYNCTWGFHHPVAYPEDFPCNAPGGVRLAERYNSTTCPRQMLCGWNTDASGDETGAITFCNIEGYAGMSSSHYGATRHMLAQMPAGRCPYPPGDRPGGGPGFDGRGHWVGPEES